MLRPGSNKHVHEAEDTNDKINKTQAYDAKRGRNDDGYLDVAAVPFGHGASRVAHKVKVKGGCFHGFTQGTHAVVKRFRPAYFAQGHRVGYVDAQMQRLVKVLAAQFNEAAGTVGVEQTLHVRDCVLAYVPAFECDMLVEREIKGTWAKFNSNNGWTCGRELPDAFSHWSWHRSHEQYLVCDLQGHEGVHGGQ